MELTVGQIVEGKITGITAFGVFLDIGDGKSGLVHISEVSRTYINDLNEVVKVGDQVKAKILNIGEDGKISLSIKRATEPEKKEPRERRERRAVAPSKPDNSYVWTPKKSESASFEEMMNKFKQTSDEKFSDLKRKNPEAKRSKRGAMK
ncbi:MAG: S1 RNA-binding domain-containing protein [Clostridia bacterium]|nr:S1 RNA-binding domain-containing protein [Clostridia bacterium]